MSDHKNVDINLGSTYTHMDMIQLTGGNFQPS